MQYESQTINNQPIGVYVIVLCLGKKIWVATLTVLIRVCSKYCAKY